MKKVLIFICLLLPLTAFTQEKRLALVIGNGDYEHGGRLANPENDAKAFSKKLRDLDFDVIEYVNLDQRSMKMAIDEFGVKLKGYDVGLFFYAGHGLQVDGNNYLIPSDARLDNATDVEYNCVRADRVLGKMESSNTKTNIVILDACRDNPFERSWNRGVKGKGLASMNAPSGSLIAYATSPGNTASDGTGKNGPYTEALLKHIGTPNLSLVNTFIRVRRTVQQTTNGQQIPWESMSLMGNFYFVYDENLSEITKDEIPSEWVIITSEPGGADLYINDQHIGQTPFQQEMKEGNYAYSLEKDLYHKESGRFRLVADEGRQKIEVVLKPNFGFAKIYTTPEQGATISIDGNMQSKTTPFETSMLKSGLHTVTVSKSMYKTQSQSFSIVDGQTTEVTVNMLPTFGKLTINSYPEEGAAISLNEQPTGEVTPYIRDRLSSGEYTVTLRKEWYETKTERFSLKDGEDKVLNLNLKPIFGAIHVTSEPGSDILIDGQFKGTGSYSGRLTAGLHTIEAKKENFHPEQAKTEIVVGEQREMTLKLKPMQGTLKIMATPLETQIKLNGTDYGTTPQTIRKLAAGRYTMELSKDGYSSVIKQIEIVDNEITEIDEELVADHLAVKEVRTEPESERIPETSSSEESGKESRKISRKESREVSGEVSSKESREVSGEVKAGTTILMSAVVPGLGLSRLSEGKPYWLLGVGGYACIASSVYFNKKAATSYDDYLNPVDIEQVGIDYDNAIQQQQISRVCAISAAAIWIGELTFTTIRVLKKKNQLSFKKGGTLYLGYRHDSVNGIPMVSLNFVF